MRRLALCATAVLALGGCATFSDDGGLDTVSRLTLERAGQQVPALRSDADRQATQQRVAALLQQPLSADAAVEIASANNPGLRARLAELAAAEAEAVRAGRLPNPLFSFGRMAGNGAVEIERGVLFNVLGLLTLPANAAVGQQRFAQAQLQAAHEAVGLAADVRRAWVDAVAAQELLAFQTQVKEAADLSNDLSRRMLQAGNVSKLAQMREQAFYADATAQLARAQHQALADKERLTRLLGLAGAQVAYRLPARLPELPPRPTEPQDAERTALQMRLDVLLARREAETTAANLGLTRATRMVNVLELGLRNKSESGSPRTSGYEVELELPLFDFGGARTARAEAVYMQAVHRTAEVAVNARSEVREAYSAYRTAYDLARHYRDEVVPLRKRISEENLLRYNGMLISVFELLADAREQVAAVQGAVQALRDFWLADTQLRTALTGRSPGATSLAAPAAAAPSAGAGH